MMSLLRDPRVSREQVLSFAGPQPHAHSLIIIREWRSCSTLRDDLQYSLNRLQAVLLVHVKDIKKSILSLFTS